HSELGIVRPPTLSSQWCKASASQQDARVTHAPAGAIRAPEGADPAFQGRLPNTVGDAPDTPLKILERQAGSSLTVRDLFLMFRERVGAPSVARHVEGEAPDLRPKGLVLLPAQRRPEIARAGAELLLEGAREHRRIGEAAGGGDLADAELLVEQHVARR